jgi:arylsulfatase A-like enzyme
MPRPNILWITLDSLKATALPVYGNPHCKAPNAERVAERGVTVSHCFAQMPKCVPNRSCMLTGRYPHVDGLRALSGRAETVERSDNFVITRGMPNILTTLKDAGYALCHKGPNHLVTWDAYEDWFDCTSDWEAWKRCQAPARSTDDPELIRAKYAGPIPDDYDIETANDSEAARQMCAFLNEQDGRRPFFAYLDIRAPHPSYRDWPVFGDYYRELDVPVPPKAALGDAPWTERVYRETYDLEAMAPEKWRQIVRAYYSAISYDDMLVGRVLDKLDACGLTENTIVIYSADHGDFAGEHGCVEKHDPILYDCHTRLPFIMSLPSTLPQGRFLDGLMEQIDIAPTLLELCGIDVPRWIQGRSLLPFIRGETETHRDVVFAQGGVEREAIDRRDLVDETALRGDPQGDYYLKQKVICDHRDFMMRAKMVRTRSHKYIYRLNGHHELYDLAADPDELQNRVNDPTCADALAELRERLIHWMLESETNLPLLDQVLA